MQYHFIGNRYNIYLQHFYQLYYNVGYFPILYLLIIQCPWQTKRQYRIFYYHTRLQHGQVLSRIVSYRLE